jgi:hypothetical protein
LEYENWLLHSDSTPTHWFLLGQEYVTKNHITLCPQNPYSLDGDPDDYYLFPKMKALLKRHRLQSAEEVKEVMTVAFKEVAQKAHRIVSSSGTTTGRNVIQWMGTTSKVMCSKTCCGDR